MNKNPPQNNPLTPSESEGSNSDLKAALNLIATHLNSRASIPDTLPGHPEDQLLLQSILETLKTTQTHLLEISEGKLDSPITLKGPFGGALKNLQSHLRHLTWKTQAIAKGDFSQKVDFLHDFSVAFNSMVKDLDEAKKSLLAKTDEIRAINASIFTSKEQYKSLIFQSPISICIEKEGTIILTNPAFEQMFFHSDHDNQKSFSILRYIHPDAQEHFLRKISLRTEIGGEWNRFEEEVITSGGVRLIAEFTVTDIIFDSESATLYFIQDITERKAHETRILNSLHEKEILLKEVYHRVKNNMQVIWALLSMQSRMVQDETVKGYFVECQNRVKSLALVHEHLYLTDNLKDIRYSSYLTQISTHLFRTYRINSDAISLSINAGDETIPLAKAVSCSLIVNELLSNTLKYAFQPAEKGSIVIRFSRSIQDGSYILEYRDSGPGLPHDLNPQCSQTLGMQLIYGLTKQLNGTVNFENDHGVHYVISFPCDNGVKNREY